MYTIEELDNFASILGEVWSKNEITDNVRQRVKLPKGDNYFTYLSHSGVGYSTAPTLEEAMNKHWEKYVANEGRRTQWNEVMANKWNKDVASQIK